MLDTKLKIPIWNIFSKNGLASGRLETITNSFSKDKPIIPKKYTKWKTKSSISSQIKTSNGFITIEAHRVLDKQNTIWRRHKTNHLTKTHYGV